MLFGTGKHRGYNRMALIIWRFLFTVFYKRRGCKLARLPPDSVRRIAAADIIPVLSDGCLAVPEIW